MFLWIIAALLIGLIAALTARAKGRPFKPWLAYGTLLGVVALPHALLLRDDEGRDDADEREAGGLFGFDLTAGRRAYSFSDQEERSGSRAGDLPPEGLVMQVSEPEAEADVAPVWSEDDFARIAGSRNSGNNRPRRASTTEDATREFRGEAFGTREDVPPDSEAGKAFDESKVETPAPRADIPEASGAAASGSETGSTEGQPPARDQDAPIATASGVEQEHASYQPPGRVAASSVGPVAAGADQEPPPAGVEPGHDVESLCDAEPPPPPPEAPESSLDIPVPPPVSRRSRRSRKAFSCPPRVQRSRLWEVGASVSEDYRREPHFDLGRDNVDDFDDFEVARVARRFAPRGADGARQTAYEDRPDRRLGFRHLVAAACITLVTFLAWWQFGWLWAPSGTDVTQSAGMQGNPAGPVPENVSPVPVVSPESPGPDPRTTASTRSVEQGAAPDAHRESANKRLPAPGDEVPLPPPMPEARARFGMTAASPSEKAMEMETVAMPSRKPAPPASLSGQKPGGAAEGKGEISATGDLVARIQAELHKRGYDIDSADGRAGTKTREAIVAFKRDNGMSATPMIDDALIERLGIAGRRLYPFTPPGRRAAQ